MSDKRSQKRKFHQKISFQSRTSFAHIILDAFKGNKVLQNMWQNGVKRKSLKA
jgi:hypothetical protein